MHQGNWSPLLISRMHEREYTPSSESYIFSLTVASVISSDFILRNQMYLFDFWFFIIIQVWYLRNHFIKQLKKTEKQELGLNVKLRKSASFFLHKW